jgi:hypothetical protein
VSDPVGLGYEPKPEAEIRAQQGLTRNHLRPGKNDVGKFRDREQCLADIGIADIVGDDVDGERINRLERRTSRTGFGHWRDFPRAV